MFIGGTDTSASIATWGMSEMMRNRHRLKLRQKLKGKNKINERLIFKN